MNLPRAAKNPWIIRHLTEQTPRLRLFCFPYAGSGAAQYNSWPVLLPGEIELNVVQLPGRESRFREPLIDSPQTMFAALAGGLLPSLDEPFAFLGHSLGALLAFETTRYLRQNGGPLPAMLFLIGRRAPQLPAPAGPVHRLPDDELLAWMRDTGGTPEQIMKHPEAMAIYLPILRADLTVNETYVYRQEPPLAIPISCFGGVRDPHASRSELVEWRKQTTADFRLRMYPGGHFFLRDYRATLLRDVLQDLGKI